MGRGRAGIALGTAALCGLLACGRAGLDEGPDDPLVDVDAQEQALDPRIEALPDAELIDKSLMIMDPSVVDSLSAQSRLDNPLASGNGAWSFGYIMRNLAGTQDAAHFTEQFLAQLTTPQTVNGFLTDPIVDFVSNPPTSAAAEALRRWCRLSDGRLDLTKAPFRLLAIVNRQDLRQATNEAGELRFIFNLLRTDDSCATSTSDASVLPEVVGGAGLNLIFEFQQRCASCSTSRSLAAAWRNLSLLPFGDSYNTALRSLTQRTVNYRVDGRPNRSFINQVRTNEPASPSQWTLRELRLGGAAPVPTSTTQPLLFSPPAATPDPSLSNSPELKAFVEANRTRIFAGTLAALPVPLTVDGRPFGGAQSRPFIDNFFVDDLVDADLNFQTCGGCHSHQATGPHVGGTFTFPSLLGRELGARASLSDFMTGGFGTDGEFPRRVALLRSLPESGTCSSVEATAAVASQRPGAVSPGEPFYVNSLSNRTSTTSSNSLRLYRVGDPDTAPLASRTLPPTAALSTTLLTAPDAPGQYEVRLFTGTRRAATSRSLSVELNVAYTLSVGSWVQRGTLFPLFWTAPRGHSPDDRVAFARVGDPTPLTSITTGPGTPLSSTQAMGTASLPAPTHPGTYELVYFRGDSGVQVGGGALVTVF